MTGFDPNPTRLRHHLFTLLAAVSFLVCGICILGIPFRGPFPSGTDWDMQLHQWLPTPPETNRHWIIRFVISITLAAITAVAPWIWLKRFVASQRERDREWRGLCRICSFDLRGSPTTCPECGTSIPLPYKGDQRKPGQSIPPGRQAIILLCLTAPLLALLIYFSLFVLIITIWPPVI
jgi:hypothetical protein